MTTHNSLTYRVRSQGDSPPTTGTELGLAVRTQVPTTVCKFGLVADAAGRCIVPVSCRARWRCGLPDHRLPVAGQLMLDTSGWNRNMKALIGGHVFMRKGVQEHWFYQRPYSIWIISVEWLSENLEEIQRNKEERRRAKETHKRAVFMAAGP